MKAISKVSTLIAALMVSAVVSAQQLKFGHFDSQTFLEAMPDMKAIEKQLDQEASNVEARLNILQEDFKKQLTDYQQKADKMTDAEKRQKEQELGELQQRIQEFVQTSRMDIQKKQQELVQPILQKVLKAVQEVGANNGFTYIFEKQAGLVLFSGQQSVDVSPLVKKKLGIQ